MERTNTKEKGYFRDFCEAQGVNWDAN